MKKHIIFLLLTFLVLSVSAQKKPTVPRTGKSDTVATREWVREYIKGQLGQSPSVVAPTLPTQAPTLPTQVPTLPVVSIGELVPLKDPLLPAVQLTGNYELRYIESRPDYHLSLVLSEKDGQLYITDTGQSLQSASCPES